MEIELTKISEKGQIVIPISLRKEMNIRRSDKFLMFGENGTIIIKKIEKAPIKNTFDEITKPLQRAAKEFGLTRRDLRKAIKEVRKNA